MALLGAGLAESRSGNLAVAYKHHTAALNLLNLYIGGLGAIQRMQFSTAMGVLLGLLGQDVPFFDSKKCLDQALSRMKVSRFRRLDREVDMSVSAFLGADLLRFPTHEVAFHIANLHMVNIMMTGAVDSRFMEELARMVLDCGEKMTPRAITFLICACAVNVGEWYGQDAKLRIWETIVCEATHVCSEGKSEGGGNDVWVVDRFSR